MNAFKELFSDTLTVKSREELDRLLSLKDCDVEDITTSVIKNRGWWRIEVTPHITSKKVMDWISSVKFAAIHCGDIDCNLRSNLRSIKDEMDFLATLQNIEYYEGYGSQELYGVIVFKDNSWLSRHEYDGSECWKLNRVPTEEEVFGEQN